MPSTPPFERTRRRRDGQTYNDGPHINRRWTPNTRRNYAAQPPSQQNLKALHERVAELASSALHPEDQKIPSEQRILYVLEQLDAIAHSLLDIHPNKDSPPSDREPSPKKSKDTTATSALLGSVNARRYPAFLSADSLLTLISTRAEDLMHAPSIFLTPAILRAYTNLQTLLDRPQTFPTIFHLYATKPSPSRTPSGELNQIPVKPHTAKSAIPPSVATLALDSAIRSHDLPLSIAIINTTFATPSHHRSKLLRHALLPSTLLALAPVSAYALATQFSLLQTTMTAPHATGIAFAGFLTYIGTVASLGYVVVTTANDQMDRVTWARGVPLWERWIREEERAAWDKVAGEWGFKDPGRRGEEEGGEWEVLREEVGRRGMGLDRVELMEGME
ncbi:uncharacterized protein LTR77_006556 [Saxophila tyrrhenica]|uniref:Uncharacterized protein n=1 Tax=Saxophila tyrrhenica TaxID=1690608 RepID=A0AAV9P5M5_9PEZI|nr:hypothetical protein LTR77_006556 [Saxophila tyrrhenica]